MGPGFWNFEVRLQVRPPSDRNYPMLPIFGGVQAFDRPLSREGKGCLVDVSRALFITCRLRSIQVLMAGRGGLVGRLVCDRRAAGPC